MTRLEKIAQMLAHDGIDAVLLTSEANCQYATGCSLEGIVFITKEGQGYCFTDSRYIEVAQKAVAPAGFHVEQPADPYPKVAQAMCEKHQVQKLAFEDLSMSVAIFNKYKEAVTCELIPVENRFDLLREIKDQSEVDCIVKAQRIAERALDDMLGIIKPGMKEYELAAELDFRMAKYGSRGVSFSTIFVSGPNTSLPHGVPSQRVVEDGDFITMDFGAIIGGYHSDMTRTVAVGHATDEMKKVYATVLEAQLAGIDAFDVGKTGHEVHMAAHDVITAAGYGNYFQHGLGHSLGLTIHENPRASKNMQATFKTGNIVTMEPGIYIPGKFGVRIEDMVYLSENGKVNLTLAPKQLLIL